MSGRYELFGPVAAGGMATVHFGRVRGGAGFQRIVAIKRLHPDLAQVPEIAASLVDEARLVSRINHKNVAPILDVLEEEGELWLVMEYVAGESLAGILAGARRARESLPPSVVSAILGDVLEGLHAAHTASSELGEPLGIVHRDVSPQNVIVGADGVSRLLDFGVAKASSRVASTRAGQIKGKLGYMAPEQVMGREVGPTTDVFAAAVVLWEALTGKRLFDGDNEGHVVLQILGRVIETPSAAGAGSSAALDAVVMRGLSREPAERYPTARELAAAIAAAEPPASPALVASWVARVAGPRLAERSARVAEIERTPLGSAPPAIAASRRRVPFAAAPVAAGPDELTRDDHGGTAEPALVVSAPPPPPVRRSRWPLFASLFALIAFAGVAALVVLRTPVAAPASRPSAAAAAPVSAPPVRAPSPPAPSASAAEVLATAAPSSAPSVPRSSPGVATRPPAPGARSRAPARAPAPEARAPSASCNPPFTVDADGIQHLKPECAR